MANLILNTTVDQYELLKEFKKIVADILSPHDTDTILLKWLKTGNYNSLKAEQYFREKYAFNQTYQIETLPETYVKPEVVEKYEFTAVLGFAKDGSIVRYTSVGKADFVGFIMSMHAYELGMYSANVLESDFSLQRTMNDKTGKDINEITYIFDLADISIQDFMHKCVYELTLDMLHVLQDYYPEIWGSIFFINVPPYFDTLYNMFKSILKVSIIDKLQVVSRDSTAETLLKYIDADVLPEFLGGKKVDSSGDPKCSEFLRFGGKIPSKYYLINRSQLMPTDPGVTSMWLGSRSVFNYPVVVTKPNSVIRLELRTENGSIYMSLLYRKFGTSSPDLPAADEFLDEKDEKCNVQKISPGMRLQTHISPINGQNHAVWPGIYIYRFNNSHSWFTSRRLIFRITVVEKES